MRPHRLRLQAFGAFGGEVEVDLDRLTESGLFLLHGPTGAGKTTLLDGIGFALFGRVPGARQSAKRLRSDHAAPGTPTVVELEVSFGTRRFRLTRSPEHERPKLRGTGTTKENAKVLLQERVGDQWVLRSNRLDEAGQEVADLVGMSAEQFFQVVLLPQGEFAQFLRAGSVERAAVLQRLFDLERFADVEQWLAGRRRATEATLKQAREEVDLLLARLAEAAGAEQPDEDTDDPVGWARDLLEDAADAEVVSGHAVALATTARDAARARLDEATALADRQQRRQAALTRREELDRDRPALLALTRETDAAGRAAEVAALLQGVADRRTAREEALTAEAVARAALAGVGVEACLDADALGEVATTARERLGQLEALQGLARTRDEELARAQGEQEEHVGALAEVAELELLLAALPLRRGQAQERAARGTAAGLRLGTLQAEREQLAAQRPDLVEQVRLGAALERLAAEHLTAREAHVALAAKANELRTASINSMVARLAFALADDSPCPVCGSLDHPDPSDLRDEGVSADDEEAARCAAEEAAAAVADVERRLAVDRATADALAQRLGTLTLAGLDERLTELDLELAVLAAEVAEGTRAQAEVDDCDRQLAAATADRVAAASRAEAAQRRADEATERAATAAAQLAAVLGPAADLAAALAHTTALAETAAAARGAVQALRTAQGELDRAVVAADQACTAAGFADPDEALAAARPADWRQEAGLRLREAADAEAAVTAALADPVLDVPLEPAAPVAERAAEHDVADAALQERVAEHARVRHRRTGVEALLPQLAGATAALAPVARRACETRQLADLCAGQGAANALRMTLSAFVLAARLEDVAAAASLRLRRMTQGRYELVHTDGAARGGSRSGLGLMARDAWSGQDRDTATLSGGETFLASLALALGLADVVTAESGGTRIEALFVDEGFGTLDEETLDEVMDVLDGLREGGRLVGLVSHVAELRHRIPARVEVRKSRQGSDLVLHGC
jgi:exonuclease SbcC